MESTSSTLFDLDAYLRKQSACIDSALESYLKKYPAEAESIFRALHYGLFPGGKRIRPILTLAAGELFGARPGVLLPFACAVEMIHAYSLIHDDLPALDNDDLRRGHPTSHKVFGEGLALLAGDGLLTEAFYVMSEPRAMHGVPPAAALNAIRELARAAGVLGLVGGQASDLEAENRVLNLAAVEAMHRRKTGALMAASVRIGAEIGGAQGDELEAICRYGNSLGLAFQIADDILDFRGERTAKAESESDRNEMKKATYPAVAGILKSKQRLGELLRLCLDALAPFGARAAALQAIAAFVAGRAIHSETENFAKEIHS